MKQSRRPQHRTRLRTVLATAFALVAVAVLLIALVPPARAAVTTILRPVGDDPAMHFRGSHWWTNSKGCSQNWKCVDDVTSDGDSTYVYHTFSPRQKGLAEDAYLMQDMAGSGTIYSVTEYAVARIVSGSCGATSETNCITIAMVLATTTQYPACSGGPNYYQLTSSYSAISYTWTSQPCTNIPWTFAAINAYSMAIIEGVSGATIRVTQVWFEVSWSG